MEEEEINSTDYISEDAELPIGELTKGLISETVLEIIKETGFKKKIKKDKEKVINEEI